MLQRIRDILAAARGRYSQLASENAALKEEKAAVTQELENFAQSLGLNELPESDPEGDEATTQERPRDERGRFVPKDEDEEEQVAA